MKLILVFLLIAGAPQAYAKLKSDWELKEGKLTYLVDFPLKKIHGQSDAARGKGHCEAGACKFLVAAPLKSFTSGDGNRDNHMLEVTKAGLFPMVVVTVTFTDTGSGEVLDAKADVRFAGKTHVYEHVSVKNEMRDGRARTSGRIPVLLSHFGVERPSLLGVKIDDAAPVDFELSWN